MKRLLFFLILTIYLVSCVNGYIVTKDGRVMKGMVDITPANPDNHKSKNDLIIKTKVDGKNRKLHFTAEEIRNAVVVVPGTTKDSTVYRPLRLRDDIFLCQFKGAKGKVSIYEWVWDTGESAYDAVSGNGYEVYDNEYILISNDSLIGINPKKVMPELYQGNRKTRHANARKVYRYFPDMDDAVLVHFINERYNQYVKIEDFEPRKIRYGTRPLIYRQTTQNLLNYIVNAENDKLSKN